MTAHFLDRGDVFRRPTFGHRNSILLGKHFNPKEWHSALILYNSWWMHLCPVFHWWCFWASYWPYSVYTLLKCWHECITVKSLASAALVHHGDKGHGTVNHYSAPNPLRKAWYLNASFPWSSWCMNAALVCNCSAAFKHHADRINEVETLPKGHHDAPM